MNILYLVDCGILDLPILYLSRYFLQNKASYYQGFRQVTEEGKWLEWIGFILDAIIYTAKATQERMEAIQKLMVITSQKIKTSLPRIYSKDLIETLFQRPYCRIRFLEEAGIARRDTASVYLKKLEEIGVFRSIRMGREKYYMNDAFIELLTH
jgi:Fic family protein